MIVIDSNVLFSALIKDSVTRKIILDNDLFLFPSYVFIELEKHKRDLILKSGLTTDEFEHLLSIILSRVKIVSETSLLKHKKHAIEMVKHIDLDDAVFVACVLAHPGSILWTDDRKLKKLKLNVKNTQEMMDY